MNSAELFKSLSSCFPATPSEKRIFLTLMNWLADGHTVSANRISDQLRVPNERLPVILKTLPSIEVDNSGNLFSIGGMTLNETPYQLTGGARSIYALSALDAVIVPTLLLRKVGVDHISKDGHPATHLRFGFDQAFTVQPQQAVVSLPSRKDLATHLKENRSEFLFFPNPDTARRWLWQNPEGVILSVKEVFAAAVQLRRSLADFIKKPHAPE